MIDSVSSALMEDKLVAALRKYYISVIDELLPNATFTCDVTKPEIADVMIDAGEDFDKILRDAIVFLIKEKLGTGAIKYFNKLNIVLTSDRVMDISNLGTEHLNSVVFIKAQVLDIALPQGYTKEAVYRCNSCDDERKIQMRPSSFVYKYVICHNPECDSEKMFLDQEECKKSRAQRITLQDIKVDNPRYLKADLKDGLVEKVTPGDKLKIVGLYLAPRISEETNRGDLILDIISIEPLEEDKDTQLTEEKIKFYEDFAKEDEENYKKRIINAYAPHIIQRDLEKWAILLNLVSAPDLMEPYRSSTNLLLVGDPGTGKSELGKYVRKVVKKSAYADGTAMTGKGLIYTLDTVGGNRILRAGIIPQNNYGHIVLDEFDKSKTEDRQSLNQCLEQQMATYDKAGFHASAETKISLIALANPNNLQWVEGNPIMDNISPIEPTTASRFDVIIHVKKISNEELDRAKARHMLDIMKGKKVDIDNEDLAGILAYCKGLNPQLSKEADKLVEDFFVKIRNSNYSDPSLVLGERQLLGIIRLAKCWTKLLFKQEVTAQIMKDTIQFYFQTLETLGLKISEGQHQIPLQTYDMNTSQAFENIINNIKNAQGMFTEAELLGRMVEDPHWKTLSSARTYWETVKRTRQVYEPKPGWYKYV